jgi:hypothetical protein
MAKTLSLGDFLPVYSGEVREAVPDYGDDLEEGAPMELDTYRGLAKSFEAGSARLLTAAKAEVPAGGPANLDELIEGLLQLERNGQALFLPLMRQAEADGASWAEPLVRALEALRDCRWHLMVLRADNDRDDRNEDAPTFSDADQLRRFRDGLS